MNARARKHSEVTIVLNRAKNRFDPLEEAANSFLVSRQDARKKVSDTIRSGEDILRDQCRELEEKLREAVQNSDQWKRTFERCTRLAQSLEEFDFAEHDEPVRALMHVSWLSGKDIVGLEDVHISVHLGRYWKKIPVESSTPEIDEVLTQIKLCQSKISTLRDLRKRYDDQCGNNWKEFRNTFYRHLQDIAELEPVEVFSELLRRRLQEEGVELEQAQMPIEAAYVLDELFRDLEEKPNEIAELFEQVEAEEED